MDASFSNVQEVPVLGKFVDVDGESIDVENVRWESEDPAIATVEQDASQPDNPLAVVVSSTGQVGSTRILLTGDADLDPEGVMEHTGVLNVEVTDSGEVYVEFEVGEPRRRGDAPSA